MEQNLRPPSSVAQQEGRGLPGEDNHGTRQDTIDKAVNYWMARNVGQKFDPFALYVFDDEKSARDALLELDCMHVAQDTGNAICTETLIFGYYRRDDGRYEAIVCGEDLSRAQWEAARSSFMKHGGTKKNEDEPRAIQLKKTASVAGDPSKVEFVRENRQQRMGDTMTYRIHRAPDAPSAKAFLEQHPVDRRFYYIVAETPEGNYARDIDGMYKE